MRDGADAAPPPTGAASAATPPAPVTIALSPRPAEPSRADALLGILKDLPGELGRFGSIPCAQRSLYTGILAGGVVSAVALLLSGTVASAGASLAMVYE